ncbi:MAG: ABC transporter ATP-binding protein [Chloroflexota bacterium]
MSQPILETIDLQKRFGSLTAVQSLSMTVQPGQVFGFLGPNGAGKTTTISMILGLTQPTQGEVRLFGETVTPQQNEPLQQVGALVGTPTLLPYLSGRDNLKLLAKLYPVLPKSRINDLVERVGLTQAIQRKFKDYSTGMKQRLGLAAALLHQPKLLILDEPTNGLDPAGMQQVRELIRELANEGVTIFLSSHLLHEVEQICDVIAIINKGDLVAQGDVATLLDEAQGGETAVSLEQYYLSVTQN